MVRNRLKLLAGALTLCLVALTVAPLAAEENVLTVAPDESVALGVLARTADEHDLGHVSLLGALLAQAERPALDVAGQELPVELLYGDSECNAERAAGLTRGFLADGRVAAIIGPTCSSACLAVAPLLDAAGYTSFTASCTLPALSEQGFTSFHRLTGPDTAGMAWAAHYLHEEVGARRIAVLHSESNAFYQGIAEELDERFTELGGEIVLEALLTSDVEEAALADLLAEIAAAGVDWLHCACDTPHTLAVLALRDAAGLGDTPILGNESGWAYRLIDLLGAGADGIYGVTPLEPDTKAAMVLKQRFEEVYGEPPSAPYYLGGYDAWHILLDAIEAVAVLREDGALHIDRSALLDYVDALEDYHGATGVISCQPGGECVGSPTGVFVIEDGEIRILQRYGSDYVVDGA